MDYFYAYIIKDHDDDDDDYYYLFNGKYFGVPAPIPGVRHSHGPGFGVRDRVRVRVRRTVGMADPGNGGPEPYFG